MKPLQIALLVVAGALSGAIVMRVAERPKTELPPVTAEVPPEPRQTAPRQTAPAAAPVAPAAVPIARAAEIAVPPSAAPAQAVEASNSAARSEAPRAGHAAAATMEHPSPLAERRAVVRPRPAWRPRPQPVTAMARVSPPSAPVRAIAPPAAAPQAPPPVAAPPAATPATPPQALPPAAAPAAVEAEPPTPNLPPARSDAENATPQAVPPLPEPNKVTLIAGLLIPVRLVDGLSSERSLPGDTFLATLEKDLVADGFVIADRGARVEGRVVAADRGGKVSGVASLAIAITRVHTSDGQVVAIRTDAFNRHADQTHRQDAETIGGAAAFGAIVGALAGGGKGAAAGAGVGGGAGAGVVLMTRGAAAALPAETRIAFRLKVPVTITEKR
jgi:hypothetical protein